MKQKKRHQSYTEPPRERQRVKVLVNTDRDTAVRITQRVSAVIQVIGMAVILSSLIGSLLISYNVIVIPGSDVLVTTVGSCVDGTAEGQCVADRTGNEASRPWRCTGGIITEDSSSCGCPTGFYVFGDGSCTRRPYAKFFTYNVTYADGAGDPGLSFIADHFDETSAFGHQKNPLRDLNPVIKIASFREFEALTDDEVTVSYPQYCADNSCNVETAYLHYKTDIENCDYFNNCATIPGWNPTPESGDPAATATAIDQSRKPNWWLLSWKDVNFTDPSWVNYNYQSVRSVFDSCGGLSCHTTSDNLILDNAHFFPPGSFADKTIEYWGIPLDQYHPRIREKYDVIPAMQDYLTQTYGKKKNVLINMNSPYYYFHPYLHSLYSDLSSPVLIEAWDAWENLDTPASGNPRAHYFDIDYQWSKQILSESLSGKKFYLQGVEWHQQPTDRGKLYLLSDFYLLNNPNLAFAYYSSATEANGPLTQTVPVSDYAWFEAMGYDIGVPTTNMENKPDVFGRLGTTEHYVFAEGADPSTPNSLTNGATKQYHVMARQYTKALVLTKFREYGGLVGDSSATTHALGGEYRALRADGTLGDPITEITLRGNEGAILIPVRAVSTCTEDWNCTIWSPCASGQQSRQCTDLSACGTELQRPALTQACGENPPLPPVAADPPVDVCANGPCRCEPNWECTPWSTCDDTTRTQSRNCQEKNACDRGNVEKSETQPCGPTGGSGDQKPPTTAVKLSGSISYSAVMRIELSGQDNVTAAKDLRYYYQLDGQTKRVAPSGAVLTLRNLKNGAHTIRISAVDEASNEDPAPPTRTFTIRNVLSVVTVPNGRALTEVKTYDYLGRIKTRFWAFGQTNWWGGSAAVVDAAGDGTGSIAVAPGRGGPPEVRIFTPAGKLRRKFNAYPSGFRGGVNLAAADVDGDGKDEIITAPASGTGPVVRVFTAAGKLLSQLNVLTPKFQGGVSVAAGFLTSRERASILVAPARNGQPQIKQLELMNGRLVVVNVIKVDSASRRVGLSVSIGNVDGAGQPEIIAAVTRGQQQPVVKIFSAAGKQLSAFMADSKKFTGGINVAAGDLQGFDNKSEIITAAFSGGDGKVSLYSVRTEIRDIGWLRNFFPFGKKKIGLNLVTGHL